MSPPHSYANATSDNCVLSFIDHHKIPRMFIHQNILLLSAGHMGIDFCRADRTVSKHFLNIADVDILFQQQSSKGVSEHMGSNMLFYSGKIGIAVDHKTDGLVR